MNFLQNMEPSVRDMIDDLNNLLDKALQPNEEQVQTDHENQQIVKQEIKIETEDERADEDLSDRDFRFHDARDTQSWCDNNDVERNNIEVMQECFVNLVRLPDNLIQQESFINSVRQPDDLMLRKCVVNLVRLPNDLVFSKCDKCKLKFVQKKSLQRHMNTVHSNKRLFHCNICGHRTKRADHFKKHQVRNHDGDKTFSCDVCSFQTTIKYKFKLHVGTHVEIICDVCQKKIQKNYHLNRHKETVHSDKRYPCNLCKFVTSHLDNLKVHIAKLHSEEKPFTCNICNFQTRTKDLLSNHIRVHSEKNICGICQKEFSRMSDVRRHKRTVHNGEKPFACNVCEFRTANKSYLRTHINIHAGDKSFKCHVCDFRTVYRYSLKNHLTRHSGERSFTCDVCNANYTSKRNLKAHRRKTHGIKIQSTCKLNE